MYDESETGYIANGQQEPVHVQHSEIDESDMGDVEEFFDE
jgi:hypothetical protein